MTEWSKFGVAERVYCVFCMFVLFGISVFQYSGDWVPMPLEVSGLIYSVIVVIILISGSCVLLRRIP